MAALASPVASFLLARAQSGLLMRPVVVTLHGAIGPCLQLSALEVIKLKAADKTHFLSSESTRYNVKEPPSVISYRYRFCSKVLGLLALYFPLTERKLPISRPFVSDIRTSSILRHSENTARVRFLTVLWTVSSPLERRSWA